MKFICLSSRCICFLVLLLIISFGRPAAYAASAAEIDKEVKVGLADLYAGSPMALELTKVAKGILVFPDVVKAGLLIGGQYGKGALLVDGATVGY
jgi:lipid-binding SYLF domain-containing protein